MAGGFFRKVAGAFVEFPDRDPSAAGQGRGAADLDAITDDAAELLAQLEHHPHASFSSDKFAPDAHAGSPASDGEPLGPSVTIGVLGMNADDVFQQSGIPDGPNSSERLLKLIAGLKMFPPEQQLVMVRAMDQADSSWAEPEVMEDARIRQASLRAHLQRIEDERAARLQRFQSQIAATRAEGQSLCDDIDARIAQLQAQREEAVVQTTAAISELEMHIQTLEGDAERARRGINQVINALAGLVAFFSAAPRE